MTESTTGVKRKRPPTFPHLPADRAKKFKKAWVDKAKIKSKWKAQKRKEGLASSSKLGIPVYNDEGDERKGADNVHSEGANDSEQPPLALQFGNRGKSVQQHQIHPSRSHLHPELAAKPSNSKVLELRPTKRRTITNDDKPEGDDNGVRGLMREAYSKSTLHTYKADPLRKRVGSGKTQGERGKGQPNMKLRMNAMLAKIKQDYA